MQIAGSRILVTGGCGFIGSTTIDKLRAEHDPRQIVIFDDLSRGTLANVEEALGDPRVRMIEGDIRDLRALTEAMAGIDAVIHLAALRLTACAEDPGRAVGVMCEGAFDVVECARESGVKKIIAASSASIYGMAGIFPTPEEHHPYGNRTLYGTAKVFLEGLLRAFHEMYGLSYVALRYFNVYGPRMDVHGRYTEVLVRWLDRIESGESPEIFGDGLQTMDFVNVADVARANILALSSESSDRVFNVGSGRETSLNELLAALLRAIGRPDIRARTMQARKVNPVSRRLASTEAARRELGFEVQVGLDQGLRELVEWRRSRRAAGMAAP